MRRICPRCQSRYGDDVDTCSTDGSPLRRDPFIGARIDRWTLTDFVGQGAMGVVYAAEPTAAIKILNARRAAMQPDLVRRFDVEAQAASRFESPHIARVFAAGTTEDGHLFIAMELLKGEPLDAIIARSPRLPPAAAVAIGHQLAGALAEAHGAEVVHRDLKPANIFIEPAPGGGRHVRLLDFGVARINSESVARSRTGSVAGTPAYMAPEQLRGEPDIDGRADIYSLGVVLYQLLSGVNPFRGPGGVMGTLRRHLELTPPPIEGVSPVLDNVVQRMLAKHRDARPHTMGAVQQLLELTGLVHRAGASATIPGMSREVLAAAGIYEAAADPEERPLVKALPPKAEPDAPDGSFPPSPSASPNPEPPTITDVGGASGAPRSRILSTSIVVGLLILAGIALGVFADRMTGTTPSPAVDADTAVHRLSVGSGPEAPDDAELREALEAMQQERWHEARALFDSVLARSPESDPARRGRERAVREAVNQSRFEGIVKAVTDKRWSDAYRRLDDFPNDSVYSPRVAAMRSRIEGGYADAELERGRLFIKASAFDGARRIQRSLARLDFAWEQADILNREIEAATRGSTAGAAPPADDPARRPSTDSAPSPRKPIGKRVVAGADATFDELITKALRRMMKSDREAAIVLLKRAAKKRPSSHLPHQRMCAIYKAQQQHKLALASCTKWLEREPNASYRPAIQRNIQQLQELINR